MSSPATVLFVLLLGSNLMMYITTPIGPKSVSSLSYQILFTKSSLDVVRSIIEPSIYCAVIDANYSLSPGFIHSQLAVFANRLLWTNLTISRNINNVGLSHCGWVFIVQRTYVVWGGRCIVAFYIITVTFVVGNQEIRSEPRERKILHIMGSEGPLGRPTPVYGGSNQRSAPCHRHRRRHG